MNYKKLVYCIFLSLFLIFQRSANAQIIPVQSGDSAVQKVEVLNYTKLLTFQEIDDSTKLTIISGSVKLRQGTTLFYCDSCVINNRTNIFEAWSNPNKQVHINDSDTIDVYANHLRYLTKRKLAYLDGNVKLTDGKGVLTTPDLEYDMETNIGIYMHGGRVVNGQTVLTSQEGWYYGELKDIYFKKSVVLRDPAYSIDTDSLLYNTATKNARFIAQTLITDTVGRIIRTSEGFYNQQTGEAQFGSRPIIRDTRKKITLIGDDIQQNDSVMIASGNAVFIDSTQGVTLVGGRLFQDKKTEAVLATLKPLMIVKQNDDSIYISADTLFSGKLSDRFGNDSLIVDTIKGTKVAVFSDKDSANRYFEAYRNVRIFNDSLQAVCDSMFYSFKDSTFRLYRDPVVWAQQNQVTGDTILLHTKNKKADKVEAFEHGFMVNRLDDQIYNQIKSTRIDGWFLDGAIDSVRARGFAECIYFIQDEDSAYTGVNQSTSDIIDIYFDNKELDRVVFRSAVTGTVWPMRQKNPDELKLEGFRWMEERRPKTRLEMFE